MFRNNKSWNRDKELYDLQNEVLDKALVVFSFILVIVTIVAYIRNIQFDLVLPIIIQSVITSLIIGLAILRKRISIEIKLSIIVVIITIGLFNGLISRGLISPVKYYLAITPIFIAFVWSIRHAVYTLLFYCLFYISVGFLFLTDYLDYNFDIRTYLDHPSSWVGELITIISTTWGVLYVAYRFGSKIRSKNIELGQQNIELDNNQKKFKALFEQANDAIVLLNNGVYFESNKEALELFGLEKEQFIGKTPWELSPEFQPNGLSSKQAAENNVAELMGGEKVRFEWQHLHSSGKIIDVDIKLSLVELSDEIYIQGILRDITEQKEIERELDKYRNKLEQMVRKKTKDLNRKNKELKSSNNELNLALQELKETQSQLMQADKMASLGVLTSGVAHELNNPLNFIQGGLEGIEEFFKNNDHLTNEELEFYLFSIQNGIDRSNSIVSSLNEFSRQNDDLDEVCDLKQIIENCLVILRHQIPDELTIEKDYTDSQARIKGNSGKLHQVFLNLLTNAIHAVEQVESPLIRIQINKTESIFQIVINDNGTGISKEDLSRIADPFYTTKAPGKGTGLGLTIVFKILDAHGAEIHFDSSNNLGTTVNLSFKYSILE
ncbi:MAG: PAS domain S-box protein [Balneolaceae bacterium]|nr:PAS domain S-box protein [Balneolaceae bacterium]